jgi:hypothetical protein
MESPASRRFFSGVPIASITRVIAAPQRPAAGRLLRVRGADFSVRESCRYRGSAVAGGAAIIAGAWS